MAQPTDQRRSFARRVGLFCAALGAFGTLAVTRDVRIAASGVSGTTAVLSFRDGAADFWSPSGAATGSWQVVSDGSLGQGNTQVYFNGDVAETDHLSRYPNITLESPANFTYESKVRSEGAAWMGITFNHAANGDHYLFRVRSTTGNWELLETSGGGTTTLGSGTLALDEEGCRSGSVPATVPTGVYVKLSVTRSSADPQAIELSYEGELQATVNDGSPREGGQVGVFSRGQFTLFHAPGVTGDITPTVELVVDTTSVEGTVANEFWGSSVSMFGSLNGMLDIITDESSYQANIDSWLAYVGQMQASDAMFPTRIRYPSGFEGHANFWNQAIGPIAGRRSDALFPSSVPVGTDEAAELAFEFGGKVNLLANVDQVVAKLDGSPTASPVRSAAFAADWVEYTNAPADASNPNGGTDWAAVRAANGHFEPFAVEVWELGNEVVFPKNGFGLVADLDDYADRVVAYASAMRAVDPSIVLGAQDDQFYLPAVPAEWYAVMNAPAVASSFDFWISHIYGPSVTEAAVIRDDVSLSAPYDFPATASYSFTVRAARENGASGDFPTIILSVDGSNVFSTAVDEGITQAPPGGEFFRQFPTYETTVTVTAGTHQIGIRVPDATVTNGVVIESVIEVDGVAANPVNLSSDPRFYEMLMGTSEAVRTLFGDQRADYFDGKPGHVTEWNTIWGQRGRPIDLKGMVANAGLVAEFLRFGTPRANFFSLYGEGPTFFGAFDGVDFDNVNDIAQGQDATPRPSAYLLEQGRKYLKGSLVATQVSPFGFHFNGDDGLTVASRGGALREIPSWVRAVSTLSPSGDRLVVMVINRHADLDLPIDLDLGTFSPVTGTEVLLTGVDVNANNEPENESGGVLEVVPQSSPLAGVGSQFTYTVPSHSVAFLLLDRTNQDPPSAPSGLSASENAGDVDLSWSASGSGDVVGYHVYRSTQVGGPYRGRVTPAPVAGTSFQDTTAERGESYRYGVRAIDADGHESGLSNVQALTLGGGVPVTTLATTINVTEGSAVAGSPANLDVADAGYYDVQASGGAAEYAATFDLPHTSSTATALAVFVNVHHIAPGSSARTLRMEIRDLNTASWVEVVNTGDTEKDFIDGRLTYGTVLPADLTRFISGAGQLRVRVLMQSAGSDILRSDFIGVRSRG